MGVPYSVGKVQDPKSTSSVSPITASNKSPQTPQAASQDAAEGTPTRNSIIAGHGSGIRRIENGKIGRPYGRGR